MGAESALNDERVTQARSRERAVSGTGRPRAFLFYRVKYAWDIVATRV